LEKELKKQNLLEVYETIEKPVIPIVQEMKENGIALDIKVLASLSKEYHKELVKLEKEIHALAEEDEFNINSPKQLAEILFTKMELKYKGMRKTSSGAYSTKEEVLHKLADVHPIAEKILQYRELSKLLGTYIDKLPEEIGSDGRLHPTFLQTGTTTGRMASQDPNIQNIPVKSELGRRIRNAFVAPKGKRLLAIDYSQIELRLAAILSEDEKLLESFKEGNDIHASVASFVFDVAEDKVDKAMRVKAKTINFGILYGMGVSALQKNLKTDRKEAQKFYDEYFATFTTLAKYLEGTKEFTAKHGYTETMFGRRRYFEGINSSLPFIRAQAERMAINAPIQGTQADVIKKAMSAVHEYLKKKKYSDTKMLLQIHDELVFEVDESVVEVRAREIADIMEGVLSKKETKGVPILVEAQAGKSWGEMKSVSL
jgi:DNA polymerase-1